MAPNAKSLANLQKAGQPSNNPLGAPRKFVTELMNVVPIKPAQVADILLSLSSMEQSELEDVLKNDKAPMMEKIVAAAMLKGLKTGNMDVLESVWNRALGSPKQSVQAEVVTVIQIIRE